MCPNEVPLRAAAAGLQADSLVFCRQIRTVAAARLSPPFAALADPALRAAVDRSVRLRLDLAAVVPQRE